MTAHQHGALAFPIATVLTFVLAYASPAGAQQVAVEPPAPEDPDLGEPPPPPLPPGAAPEAVSEADPTPIAKRPWHDRIQLRGYTQVRYNRLPSLRRNDDLINLQGDRSIGGGNGFLIRRARLILYGDVHEHLAIYLQPDFASVIDGTFNVANVRDWYADVFLDKQRQFRFRVGQSKVPYGFENMQSSQNRLPFDRNDALNSAVKDERDLGVFFYWSPPKMRELFLSMANSIDKGSGDYGMLALGVYNGQTANRPAQTDNLHVIARLAVPMKLGNQILEFNAGGYYGKYKVSLSDQGGTTYTATNDGLLLDARAYGAIVLYPRPIGFVAEATVGVGPMQGRDDPTVIDSHRLQGGYAQVMAKIDGPFGTVALFPYVRLTYYDGGKKFMPNAPRYEVRELEAGLEWQIHSALELVLAYQVVERTSDRYPHNLEFGHVSRVQLQFNY
jgi:hypothetical protein